MYLLNRTQQEGLKMKTQETMLMHPQSGQVQSEADWREEQKSEGWPDADFDTLIEVVMDSDGNWIEEGIK
jgi:hypothetical protein